MAKKEEGKGLEAVRTRPARAVVQIRSLGLTSTHDCKSHRPSPGGSAVKNPPAMQEPQETWVRSQGWEDPLQERIATHSIFLPGEFHGRRSLAGLQSMGSQKVGHN